MTPEQFRQIQSRRQFLRDSACGIGTVALAHLLAEEGRAAVVETNPLAPRPPHFAPKAKNVIFMFMEGGPSQLDLFDPKPELEKWDGKPLPASLTKDLQLAFIKPTAAVLASRRKFAPRGQCGMEISDFLPHLGEVADDICLVRSMHTDAFNHHPGQLLLFSGTTQVGRPTLGAWSVYGLGSESQDLPGFVVLSSGKGTSGGASNEIFEIKRGDVRMALRRPPRKVPRGRNETMLREYRVLAALNDTDVPHPRAIAACDDPSVLGACFYLMGHVDGWSCMNLDAPTGWPPLRPVPATRRDSTTLQ